MRAVVLIALAILGVAQTIVSQEANMTGKRCCQLVSDIFLPCVHFFPLESDVKYERR